MVLTKAPSPFRAEGSPIPTIWRIRLPAESAHGDIRFALGDGQRIQVLDQSPDIDSMAVAIIPLDLEGFDRIEAVRRFLAALHGRAIPPDTRLTRQQRARLRRMLQAFDGYRAGATQQEIARVLLKAGYLDRDEWQASSARHTIKSLLRDARSMVAGGYRKLLRHRRPR